MQPLTITLHMVSSLDGYIAKKDNSVSWFETADVYEQGVPAENPEEVVDGIGCYVMGSRTYEHALELSKSYGWVYGDKPTIVLTSRKLPVERQSVEFFSGDLETLVNDLLKPSFNSTWVVGGSTLIKSFLREGLADEIRISILPVLLGDGKHFFEFTGVEKPLHLKDAKAFRNGMVELCYQLKF